MRLKNSTWKPAHFKAVLQLASDSTLKFSLPYYSGLNYGNFYWFQIFSFSHMELSIWINLEKMTTLHKTVKQRIYLWIVSTVKITTLQTCNIHTFIESTKCKTYVLASVSWFGPFYQATVQVSILVAWQNFQDLEW